MTSEIITASVISFLLGVCAHPFVTMLSELRVYLPRKVHLPDLHDHCRGGCALPTKER